ncbi:MAG TPA: hypothetical protein VGK30_05215 [Candidatus Binatia bacterium]|jgi:hypothetical protein
MQAELREIEGDGYEGVDPSDFGIVADVGVMRARSTVEPERNLLLAVLTDAIIRYQALAGVSEGARKRDLGEAERWLFSNDRRWPYSFVNVCEALEIAPSALRRQLVSWRAAQAARRRNRGSARRSLLKSRRAARVANTSCAPAMTAMPAAVEPSAFPESSQQEDTVIPRQ